MEQKALPEGVDIITLMGPTATGKTAVAVEFAHMLGGVVLSADSRQVYRGMDLGTGKDLSEYRVNGEAVPHYLIDICEAGERYNLHRYLHDFHQTYHALPPSQPKVLCGGTGLYIEAVLGGYALSPAPEQPQLRARLEALTIAQLQHELAKLSPQGAVADPQNRRRLVRAIEVALYEQEHGTEGAVRYPPLRGPIFYIEVPREVRRARISARLERRLQEGMIEEVRTLLTRVAPEQLIYYGLEYKYLTEYVVGQLTYTQMKEQLEVAIHQFAKRQMTWIRGMQRRGYTLQPISPLETPRATAEALRNKLF